MLLMSTFKPITTLSQKKSLGLVCVLLCNLCYLYSLVKMDCGVLFYLV